MTKKGNKNPWEPIKAQIPEPYEGPKNHIEEIEEEENDFNKLAAEFLMAKLLQLYMIFDFPNFEKNKEKLVEEMEIYIRNHKDD